MFLYPALIAGFAFVVVPPLVHLINMLRHRKRQWAAMDFLLSSYRKQRRWMRLRQFLLLLARLAVAALLVAMLCGWTGGDKLLGVLGDRSTHHVVILDDSYSMGDVSGGVVGNPSTAYRRALDALRLLQTRIAASEGLHQLTVIRTSKASFAISKGNESGDAIADLSAQTVTGEDGLLARLMATAASPIRCDLVPATDLAAQLIEAVAADQTNVYVLSDFRQREWGTPQRMVESFEAMSESIDAVNMIECAATPSRNLAVTNLEPVQDVWVSGVPVVVNATIRNYSSAVVKNVAVGVRVIRYGDSVQEINALEPFSGQVEALPAIVIESLDPGAEITKSFQVYIAEKGTHAIEVELPSDAVALDNKRVCTLPLTDVERVLIIDSDVDQGAAYALSSVLNPGGQVRIGAVPDVQPPAFLRSLTLDTLKPYRAVYLVDLPEVTDGAAEVLSEYVRSGGGLAWFLGESVDAARYNETLLVSDRQLLPGRLDEVIELDVSDDKKTGDLAFEDDDTFVQALKNAGSSIMSLVGLDRSWSLAPPLEGDEESEAIQYRVALARSDSLPFVTEHRVGDGVVVTVLAGLNRDVTNWTSDPTFVPFVLLANARLWSGAAFATSKTIGWPLERTYSNESYFPEVKLAAPALAPPRPESELAAKPIVDSNGQSRATVVRVVADPVGRIAAGEADGSEAETLLQPGLFEWELLKTTGGAEVIPLAIQIESGEGDLTLADTGEIRSAFMPLEVQFFSSSDWRDQNQTTQKSSMTLLLLLLLVLLLFAEQALAYWASYHVASGAGPAGVIHRHRGRGEAPGVSFGLAATHGGGDAS